MMKTIRSRKKFYKSKNNRKRMNKSKKNNRRRKHGGSLSNWFTPYYTKNEQWEKACKTRISESSLKEVGDANCEADFCGKYLNKPTRNLLRKGVKGVEKLNPFAISTICGVLKRAQKNHNNRSREFLGNQTSRS